MPTTSSDKRQVARLVLPAGMGRPGRGTFLVAAYWREMGEWMVEAVCTMHDAAIAVRDLHCRDRREPDEVGIFRETYGRLVLMDQNGKVIQDNEAEANLLS